MDVPIRVLHLEDNALDAELIQRKLIAECPACELVWTRGRADYEAAIDRESFDLILSDYNLPDYSGLAALQAARDRHPYTPVIVVTGTLSEDEAVECIKAGATDYILKSRLQRLGPAVTRALGEAAEQHERRQVEAALRISEERLQLALEASEVSVWEHDISSGHVTFSRQLGPMLGYASSEVPARIDAWEALTHPSDIKKLRVELPPLSGRPRICDSPAAIAHAPSL
jgi:DNA-binding response OmpR family regulator